MQAYRRTQGGGEVTGSQEEIRRLRDIIQAYESELVQAKALCLRAADALACEMMKRTQIEFQDYTLLIAELREVGK